MFSILLDSFRRIGKNSRIIRVRTSIESAFIRLLLTVLYTLVAVGVVAYFVRCINALVTREPTAAPLQLATIVAALGGLILIGAFYKNHHLKSDLIARFDELVTPRRENEAIEKVGCYRD